MPNFITKDLFLQLRKSSERFRFEKPEVIRCSPPVQFTAALWARIETHRFINGTRHFLKANRAQGPLHEVPMRGDGLHLQCVSQGRKAKSVWLRKRWQSKLIYHRLPWRTKTVERSASPAQRERFVTIFSNHMKAETVMTETKKDTGKMQGVANDLGEMELEYERPLPKMRKPILAKKQWRRNNPRRAPARSGR
jgi:hypothetical protein